jgi:hypothetical protein
MRYPKGSIDLTSPQDLLLLQHVLRSGYVSHDQLWKFFQPRAHEHRRRIFNWRLSRLVDHEFVWRAPHGRQTWIYSITERGAEYLIGCGDPAALVALGESAHAHSHYVAHALDLNEIHLALIAGGRLSGWKSEIEIRSQNELTGFGYAKDYDAIVSLDGGSETRQFALEYERQPKAAHRYPAIREATEKELQVQSFVYIVPAYSMLAYVAGFFQRCERTVCFGLLDDVRRHGIDADVMDWRRTRPLPLTEVLSAR